MACLPQIDLPPFRSHSNNESQKIKKGSPISPSAPETEGNCPLYRMPGSATAARGLAFGSRLSKPSVVDKAPTTRRAVSAPPGSGLASPSSGKDWTSSHHDLEDGMAASHFCTSTSTVSAFSSPATYFPFSGSTPWEPKRLILVVGSWARFQLSGSSGDSYEGHIAV